MFKNNLTVKTGQRIFLVHYLFSMGKQDMCNLEELNRLFKVSQVKKVQHFWNGKFTQISRKDIKDMCERAKLPHEHIL